MAVDRTRQRPGWIFATALVSLLLLQGQQCAGVRDRALQAVEAGASALLDEIGAEGWRIHIHPEIIESGAVVAAFSLTSLDIPANPTERLVCEEQCLLFFIDTQPLHHFAHPTVIGLYDVESSRLVGVLEAEWWPTIDGRSVFHTVSERRRQELIVVERGIVPPIAPTPPSWDIELMFFSPPEPKESDKVWAVVVNGYDDPADTFDEDTVGMYRVLQGLGIPEDNIQLLRPEGQTDDGIPDVKKVSVQALEQALKAVKGQSPLEDQPCDDFLLFYSAHGIFNNLACGTDPDHAADPDPLEDWVSAAQLKSWLEESVDHCANVTLVIEACKSGSILQHSESSFRSQPGQGTWQMFASAAAGESSAGDVDTADDENPSDVGSETIWGYVEAFGTSSADADDNGWVDFAEAVAYANFTDATEQHIGQWHPALADAAGLAVHGSDLLEWGGELQVELSPGGEDAPEPDLEDAMTRCCDFGLDLKVKNISDKASSMPLALRVFRPDPDTDWEDYYFEKDNLRTTLMLPGIGAGKEIEVFIDFGEVPKSFAKGAPVTMRTIVDHLEPEGAQAVLFPTPASGTANDELFLTVKKCFWDVCCWLSGCFCP